MDIFGKIRGIIINWAVVAQFALEILNGGHWYDSISVSDLKKLNCWLSKNNVFYKCNARVWSKADVTKRRTAAQNNLRYVVFWNNDLSDFDSWVESGMPVRYDWK